MTAATLAMRFYAAVWEGRVVAALRTGRRYTHVVIYLGPAGPFATFHETLEHAERATQLSAFRHLKKRIIEAIETPTRLPIGSSWGES
jgi:hypothetical protein